MQQNINNNDLKLRLISADKEGNILSEIYEVLIGSIEQNSNLPKVLVELHNQGIINIVEAFMLLQNVPKSEIDFFLIRHAFEESLPNIESPIEPLMECVLHLYRIAKKDIAAGSILTKFIDFCQKKNCAIAVVQKIEDCPEKYLDLLVPSIIAGSRNEPEIFLNEAIRLSSHENSEIRQRALFSMSKIEFGSRIDSCLDVLEDALKGNSDDNLCVSVIKSAFALYKKSELQHERIIRLIENALSSNGDNTLQAASEVLWVEKDGVTDELQNIFLNHLLNVKPHNTGTIHVLDCVLTNMLTQHSSGKAIQFIENYLDLNANEISISHFPQTINTIKTHKKLFEKLATKWLLKGQRILCEAIIKIALSYHDKHMNFEVDLDELPSNSQIHKIFLARKIIGYLFFAPDIAANFLISLLKLENDSEVVTEIIRLILDPLALSHPNILEKMMARDDVKTDIKLSTELEKVRNMLAGYLEDIIETGKINELRMNEHEREMYMHRMSQLMRKSFEEVEQESAILKLIHKSVILYGRGTINYVYAPDGNSQRMESGFQSYSTTMNMPRLNIIDPVSLDYTLRIYRVEKFID